MIKTNNKENEKNPKWEQKERFYIQVSEEEMIETTLIV